jgi:hypothetical protein
LVTVFVLAGYVAPEGREILNDDTPDTIIPVHIPDWGPPDYPFKTTGLSDILGKLRVLPATIVGSLIGFGAVVISTLMGRGGYISFKNNVDFTPLGRHC